MILIEAEICAKDDEIWKKVEIEVGSLAYYAWFEGQVMKVIKARYPGCLVGQISMHYKDD
jgi:hypothetical protein